MQRLDVRNTSKAVLLANWDPSLPWQQQTYFYVFSLKKLQGGRRTPQSHESYVSNENNLYRIRKYGYISGLNVINMQLPYTNVRCHHFTKRSQNPGQLKCGLSLTMRSVFQWSRYMALFHKMTLLLDNGFGF